MASALNPVPFIAATTRRLQALQPQRAIKGLTRFSSFLHRWLPSYQGVIRLPDGLYLEVDSAQPAERWLLFAGNYQPAVTNILQQHTPPQAHCLDVGANLGFYTLKLAHWAGPTGQVAAIEANPALVDRIARNVALNKFDHVTLVPQPVHCRIEPVTFYISPSPGKSSIHSAHVADPVDRVELQTTTIDTLLRDWAWPRLDVIKLDIEGNDCNALLGAQESLARFRPFIVFEYWYDTPADIADRTFGLLADLGYTLRCLFPNSRQIPFDRSRMDGQHIDVIGFVG